MTPEGFVGSLSSGPVALVLSFFVIFLILIYAYNNSSLKDHNKFGKREKLIHFRQLPSPMALPIFGHLIQLGSHPHLVLTKWSSKYGSLFRIKMGFKDILIISGIDNVKKGLLSTAFAGRPELETSKLISEGLSLTFSDYNPTWEHQKTAAKAAVSLFTTGKNPTKRSLMETSANKHANNLINQLLRVAENENGTVDPRNAALASASSSICQVCFGKDFDVNHPKLLQLTSINHNFDQAMATSQPVNFWPVLKHCPRIARSYTSLKFYSGKYWSFVTEMIHSHEQNYDAENLRDLVDCLYHERDKERRNNNDDPVFMQNVTEFKQNSEDLSGNDTVNSISKTTFNVLEKNQRLYESCDKLDEIELKKRIMYTTGDLFGAGYDTVFTMIHWVFLYLAVFPEAQAKIREEIDCVMSDEELSLRLHGSKCPYTIAWIYELMRHCTPSPILLPHCTTREVTFDNCIIPAGVMVYFNVWQTTHDPNVWENPNQFNPYRFLTQKEDGSLSLKRNCTNNLLSWGTGVRKCLGYHLSKHQIFIFLTNIVGKTIVKPFKVDVEPVLPWPVSFGLTLKPKRFRIKIEKR